MAEQHPLDTPRIINNLFFVRKTPPNSNPYKDVYDGTIPVEDDSDDRDIELGYRLYLHRKDTPVLMFFHGNGEIANDYDDIAPYYHLCGVSLLIVDYRGYGWSTGTPKTSTLLTDAAAALQHLPTICEEYGITSETRFLKGRSLGSAPAIYLASHYGDSFSGLIVESGYADAPSLFRRLGIEIPDDLNDDPTLPLNNVRKMKAVSLPLLVIHGKDDKLIPVGHSEDLFAASPAYNKELLVIEGANHNNLMSTNTAKYFDAIKRFIADYS